MKPSLVRGIVAGLALIVCSVLARAESVVHVATKSGVTQIKLTAVSEYWDGASFLPVRIQIDNRGKSTATWTFQFNIQGGWSENGVTLSKSAEVSVAAGASLDRVVYLPGTGRIQEYLDVVSVNVLGEDLERTHYSIGDYRRSSPLVGVSPGMDQPFRVKKASVPVRTDSGSYWGSPDEYIRSVVVVPSFWPADWRVYGPFDHLVFSQQEFDALDQTRKDAILDWVALGGRLHLFPSGSGKPGEKSMTFDPASGLPKVNLANQSHGVGHVFKYTGQMPDLSQNQFYAFSYEGGGVYDNFELPGVGAAMGTMKQAIDSNMWLCFFIVGFGVVIGPLNLFVLAPAKRRHRLFFTMPLFSIMTAVILGVLIVYQDGFGGEGIRSTRVILLPEKNKAVVIQKQFAHTGVLLGKTFALADDVVLSFPAGAGGQRKVFRQNGQALGEWFTSRADESHDLRALKATRARIEKIGQTADGAPLIQSSLPVPLRSFRYVDQQGGRWTARLVPPGQKVRLERVSLTNSSTGSEMRNEGEVWPDGEKLPNLENGGFIGEGQSSELGPVATLESIDWSTDIIYYSGKVEELLP